MHFIQKMEVQCMCTLLYVYFINLTFELFVENWYVIVILCLIHVTRNRIAKLVFSSKLSDRKLATIIATPIGQSFLSKIDLARLFVHQEYISMETCFLRRSGSNIRRQNFPFGHICARNIAHQPVMPFAEFRFFSAWSIRICLNKNAIENIYRR